jgi:heme/copper-type cytochrome/quinol oxidase subunit 1
MTTIDTTLGTATDTATDATDDALNPFGGLLDWVGATDHKRTGRLLLGGGLLALIGAAVCGVLLAVDAAAGEVLDIGVVPQVQSIYLVGLTFGVLVPLMLGAAIAVVPLQVGARSIAFPRLAQFGVCTWFVGTVLTVVMAMLNGGLFGGDDREVALFLLSFGVMLLGLWAAALSLVNTILTTRTAGMNMRRVPPFTWASLVGGLGLLLGLPVLLGNLLYSWVAVRYEGAGFTTKDDVFSWLSFGFLTPVSIMFAVGAFGFAADALATATRSRLPQRGVLWAGIGLAGTGVIAMAVQNPATIRNGLGDADLGDVIADFVRWGILSGLPLLGSLVVLGILAAALKGGRPRLQAPFVFGVFAAGMVFVGAAVSALVHIEPVDLIGTPAQQSAWLYVVYGGVLAGLGAIIYWGPKWSGRQVADKVAIPLALLGVLATVLAALPLLLAGLVDDESFVEIMWWLSAAGHALMVLTVLAVVALALRGGRQPGDDPWDGQTLEWATTSPAPFDNFPTVFVVQSAEPLLDLKPADAATRSDA